MNWFKERVWPWIVYVFTIVYPFSKFEALLDVFDETLYSFLFIAWIPAFIYSVKALFRAMPDWLFAIFGNLYAYSFGINRMRNNPLFNQIVSDARQIRPDAIVLYGKHQNGSRYYKALGDYDKKKGYRFNHVCFVDSIDPSKDYSMQGLFERHIKYAVDDTTYSYTRGNDYCFTKMGYRVLSKLNAFALYKALCNELPDYSNQQGLEKIRHGKTTYDTGKTITRFHISSDKDGSDTTIRSEEYPDTETRFWTSKDYCIFFIVKPSVDIEDTDADANDKLAKARKAREKQDQKSLKKW